MASRTRKSVCNEQLFKNSEGNGISCDCMISNGTAEGILNGEGYCNILKKNVAFTEMFGKENFYSA